MSNLTVLIANIALIRRTGTQIVVRDLCSGLRKEGHQPMVYSPQLGEIADEIRLAGTPVVDDLSRLPAEPDIIHSNQHSEGLEAFLHFPSTWHVNVCHSATSRFNVPLLMPYIGHFVAVDQYCYERLHKTYGIPAHRVRVIYNAVDTQRFRRRDPLPERPRRAVVFSNYAGEFSYVRATEAACRQLDIELDVVGEGVGRAVPDPENILGEYDLVFAKARAALEAMAVGCAVVLCDFAGVGQMVTSASASEFRRWNFGRRLLTKAHTPETLVSQIRRYDAQDANEVCNYIRANATLDSAVAQYVQLYRDILTQSAPQASCAEQFRQYVDIVLKYVTEYESYSEHSPLADDAALRRLTTERDELKRQLEALQQSFPRRFIKYLLPAKTNTADSKAQEPAVGRAPDSE